MAHDRGVVGERGGRFDTCVRFGYAWGVVRTLELKLENDQYDRLVSQAAAAGKEPGDIMRGILDEWLGKRVQEQRQSEWKDRMRYVRLRIKGQETGEIAEALKIDRDTVLGWEREIKTIADVWSKAYFELKKGMDPLLWEMTYRDKFTGIWGDKPGDG